MMLCYVLLVNSLLGLYNLSQDLILDSGYSGALDLYKWNVALDHTKDATQIILDFLRGDAPRKNIPRCAALCICGACTVQQFMWAGGHSWNFICTSWIALTCC